MGATVAQVCPWFNCGRRLSEWREPVEIVTRRGGREGPYGEGCTMAAMAPGAAPKLQIPRWIQLVGLPVLLILAWVVAGRVFHVVFLFLVASLVALLVNPLVNAISRVRLGRFRIRRGLAVTIVYLCFAAVLIISIWALATVVVDQTKTAANRFDTYFTIAHGPRGQTDADRDVDRLQHWLDTHGLKSIKIQQRGHKWVEQIRQKDVGKYTTQGRELRRGGGDLDREAALRRNRDPRRVGLHAARPLATRDRSRPSLPATAGLGAAARADGEGGRRLREGPVPGVADHRLQRRLRHVAAGRARLGAGGGQVRAALRCLGGGDRADPVPRAVARRDSGGHLRGGRRPDLGALGGDPVPAHPPGRGPHRRPERDGQRAPPAPVARHLRPARRRGDLRARRASSSRCRSSPPARAAWEFFSERVALEPWGAAGRSPSRSTWSHRRPPRRANPRRRSRARERGPSTRCAGGRRVASATTSRSRPPRSRCMPARLSRLVGPNGAGKSTLLAILAGALEPTPARSSWAQACAPAGCRSGRRTTAVSPRGRTSSCSRGWRGSAIRRRFLARFELPDDGRPATALSVGNRQRLDLAISLLGDPRVLLLDEPTAALDPRQRRRLWETACDCPRRGRRGRLRHAERRGPRARRRPGRRAARRRGRLRPGRSPSTSARRSRERSGEGVAPDPAEGPARPPPLAGPARGAPRLPTRDRAPDRADRRVREREAAGGARRPRRDPGARHRRGPELRRRRADRRRREERRARPDVDRTRRRSSSDPGAWRRWSPSRTGFVSELKGLVSSPHLTLATGTGGITPRVRQQMQALVYNLNQKLQTAFIQADLDYVEPAPERRRAAPCSATDFSILGLDGTAKLLDAAAAVGAEEEDPGLRPRRAPGARAHRQRRPRDRRADRARRGLRQGRSSALSAQVQAYGLAMTITFLGAPARGGRARRRAGRERDRPARPRPRRARPARGREGRPRRHGRARARSRAPARVRDRGGDRGRPRGSAVGAHPAGAARRRRSPAPRWGRSAR